MNSSQEFFSRLPINYIDLYFFLGGGASLSPHGDEVSAVISSPH